MSTPSPVGTVFDFRRLACFIAAGLMLAACDEQGNFNLGNTAAETKPTSATAPGIKFSEEDVEAPEVFSATEAGLWDGRPSLGGVWVAYPDVKQPERVIIRNMANGKFVIGALFRRERDIPGPRLQLSSDAAQAIDVLAGAPVELSVVALRREKVAEEAPETEIAQDAEAPIAEATEIEATTLDPIAAAGAAIEASEPAKVEAETIADAASAPETEETEPESRLGKPLVQVAVFKVEDNAKAVSEQMRSLGLTPTLVAEEADGAKLWRVLVGPAMTWNERRLLLKKVKDEGYADAYAVAK